MQLLDKDALYGGSVDVGGFAGLYFLFDGPELVYVGQSNNAYRRVSEHRKYGRVFNRMAFLAVADQSERDSLEAAYIEKFAPKYNGDMASLMSEEAKIKRRLRRKAWRLRYPDRERAGVNARHRRWRQRASA